MTNESVIKERIEQLKRERDDFVSRNYIAILEINRTLATYESAISELEKLISSETSLE